MKVLRKLYSGGGALIGFLAGALFLGLFFIGIGSGIAYTNTLDFCISCHEMETTVYQEYKKSLHYNNRIGTRAECPDCHVPREYPAKLISKVVAVKDVWHHLLGSIDTPEKFEAKRLVMAEKVWHIMESTDSRECRNCHTFDAMLLEEQGRRGRRKHPQGMEEGKSCINCHKGVAHNLPEGYSEG